MHEVIMFEPLAGLYDLDRVAAAIARMPFAFRDPTAEEGPFLLCGNAVMTAASRRQLLGEPDSGYPYVALVVARPERIMIRQECEADAAEQAREFGDWLRGEFPSRVLDGYGTDLSALVPDTLAPLYQP